MKFELTHEGNILSLVDASELEIDQLNESLRKRIDNWRWDPRVKKGWWDGYISYFKNEKYAPSGLWNEIMEMGKRYDMPVEINGLDDKFDNSVSFDEFVKWSNKRFENSEMKPRDYQIETAWKVIKYKSCLAELATSAGKSFIMFMVFSYLLEKKKATKILMIVPNVSLVVQGAEDFYEYNSGNRDLKLNIQQIFAGQKLRENCNIIIGTYQSLVKKKKDYFDQFDVVCVDETHKAKSTSIKTILEKCNCSRKFGMSGTVPKEGTLDRLTLMAYTGPLITQIKAKFLQDQGHISTCKVKILELNYATQEAREAFEALTKTQEDRKRLLNLEQNFVIQNKMRLEFVTDVIKSTNKNCLVLFFRVDYGKAIFDKLRMKTDNRKVFYIDGGVGTDLREDYKAEMEEGEGKIMVASYGTFSTGINVRNLHTVFLTESFKSDVIIRQSIGRGLRKHETKDGLTIVDFVDDFRVSGFKNYLYKHSLVRREIYNEEQFPYEIQKIDLNKIYLK
jgi:superfamily II DNA or RNA helicase